jgi:hypothetical protein
MEKADVLRELFDEKIIKILTLFLDEPEKHFSLTEASSVSGVNVATALRILDKLVKKGVVEITLMGRSKFYKLKRGEKTIALNRLLKNEEGLTEFIDRAKEIFKIKRIVLESKTDKGAKLIIVGDLSTEKIDVIVSEIKKKYGFSIQYFVISEGQFNDMEKMGLYGFAKKLIWDSGKIS